MKTQEKLAMEAKSWFIHWQQYFILKSFYHNMKKLRNSILKSGAIKGVHTRKLTLHGFFIAWKQWEMAGEWGRTVTARRIHHRVTYSVTHKEGEKSIKSQEISK